MPDTDLILSSAGLAGACAGFMVHGVFAPEWVNPRLALNCVHYIFFPMFRGRWVRAPEVISNSEYEDMTQASIKACMGPEKQETARDLMFLFDFERRQGSVCWTAMAVASFYALGHGLDRRDAVHLCNGVMAVLMALVHVNNFIQYSGNHSPRGRVMASMFGPFFVAVAALNWLSFLNARDAAGL